MAQNALDFEQALVLSKDACARITAASRRAKAAAPNSTEQGSAQLDKVRAWADVCRANILAWPFTSGPEFDARVSNLDAQLREVARVESLLAALADDRVVA